MIFRPLFLLFFIFSPVWCAEIHFTFDEWALKESENYVAKLVSTHQNLKEDDLKISENRAKDLRKNKDWGALVLELERLAAKKKDDFNAWLNLAEAALRQVKKTTDTWTLKNKAQKAAIHAYKLAKNDGEKAQALIFYGDAQFEESDDRQKILALLFSREDLKKIKQDPRFSHFLRFEYKKYALNTDKTPNELSFTFTSSLDSNQNIQDFIESTPKFDGKIQISDNKVILKGLPFGRTYDFTLKPGIQNKYFEKIIEPIKVGVKVTDQSPRLVFKNQQYILQKSEKLFVPLTITNVDKVKVKIVRLGDTAIPFKMTSFQDNFLEDLNSHAFSHFEKIEAHKIFEGAMETPAKRNTPQTMGIPLHDVIKDQKPGIYIIYVKDASDLREYPRDAAQWVVITDVGLTTFSGNDGVHIDVRKLSTAKSYKNVKINLIAHNNEILASHLSDEHGHVFFEKSLLQGKDGDRPLMLSCHGEGSDFTFLDLRKAPLDLSDLPVAGLPVQKGEDLYIYGDRGVYRPGESIHFHALLRDTHFKGISNATLTFKLVRPDGMVFKVDQVKGNEAGVFEHHVDLLTSSPTGLWTVQGFADPKSKEPLFQHTLSVEDFTPAKILVKAITAQKILGTEETLKASVKTEYLFGGKVGALSAEAVVLFSKNRAPFEHYTKFKFGDTLDDYTPQRLELALTSLDEKGEATLSIDGKSVKESSTPLLGQLRVNVFDVGGKSQIGTAKFSAFTQPFYIGIAGSDRMDGDATQGEFLLIALTKNGVPHTVDGCTWNLYKEKTEYTWYQSGEKWQYNALKSTDLLESGTLALKKEPTPLSLNLEEWGDYILEVKDTTHNILSKIRFTKGWGRGDRLDVPDLLKVRLDKEDYKIGDDVIVHIESPFEGEGLLSIANAVGIVQQVRLPLKKNETLHTLKVTDAFGVGAYIMVNAFRPLSNEISPLPLRAMGLAWCPLDKGARTFTFTLSAPEFAKPRENFEVMVHVESKNNASKKISIEAAAHKKGAKNKPSEAAASTDVKDEPIYLTLAAVDEGILLLTDYKNPDPLAHFYGKKAFPLDLRDVYGHIMQSALSHTGALHTGGDEGALARNLAALSKRSFKLVSLYSGTILLKDGHAKIPFAMPDFNGKVRLMGVVASKDYVGAAQASVTVKDPIVVDMILPNFLAPGDKSELILSLHNQKNHDEELLINITTEGPVELEKKELKIQLKQNSESVFTLPFTSTEAGNASFQLHLIGSDGKVQKYTQEISIREGRPFKTTQTAVLLEQRKPIVLEKQDEKEWIKGSAQISLSFGTAPWNSHKIAQDLEKYPYGCIEQTVSRGWGVLTNSGDHEGKILDEIVSKIAQDQTLAGGFNLWSGSDSYRDEKLFHSAYVHDFLYHTKKRGVIVPSFTLENLEKFLKKSIQNLSSRTSTSMTRAAAYALYTLINADVVEPGVARYFYDTWFDTLESPFAKACVLHALSHFDQEERLKSGIKVFSEKTFTAETSLFEMIATVKILEEAALNNTIIQGAVAEHKTAWMYQIKEKMHREHKDALFSTLEKAWMVRSTTTKAVHEIALNIDGQKITGKAPLKKEFKEISEPHHMENLNESPVWMSITTSGQPAVEKEESHGLSLSRKLFTLDGTPLTSTTFTQGQVVVCVMEGSIADEKSTEQKVPTQHNKEEPDLGKNSSSDKDKKSKEEENKAEKVGIDRNFLLVNLLPGGVQLDAPPKLSWLSGLTPTLFESNRDDRFVASLKLLGREKTFKIAYVMRMVTKGEYIFPGSFCEDMGDARTFAQNKGTTVTIGERKVIASSSSTQHKDSTSAKDSVAPKDITHTHTHGHAHT